MSTCRPQGPQISTAGSSFFFYLFPLGASTFSHPHPPSFSSNITFGSARTTILPTHGAGHPQRQRVSARDICPVPLSCAYPVAQPANKQSAFRKFRWTSHSRRPHAVTTWACTLAHQFAPTQLFCVLPEHRDLFSNDPIRNLSQNSRDIVQSDKTRHTRPLLPTFPVLFM